MSKVSDVLRSADTKYRQIRYALRTRRYPNENLIPACAVGVLCLENNVTVKIRQVGISSEEEKEITQYYGLDAAVKRCAYCNGPVRGALVYILHLNDFHGFSFVEIADTLDREESAID
mgnify:FL=1